MRVLITGGFFDQSDECFVDEVDLRKGERMPRLRFVPPPDLCIPTKGFTGARWLDARTIVVASFCAVWRVDVRAWTVTGVLHQPDFNDLHDIHIDQCAERLYVCNTGLDAIEVFDLAGRFLGRHSLSPAWFDAHRQHGMAVERARYDAVIGVGWTLRAPLESAPATGRYYDPHTPQRAFHRRIVRDYAHPNFVNVIRGRLVVTLLARKEMCCLHTLQPLATFDGHPHDGRIFDGRVWTTTTDGAVLAWDPTGPDGWRLVERYHLTNTGHVGWCRGLFVSDQGIAVALTRMHGPSQYAWRSDPIERTETSVLWLERGSGRLLGRLELDSDRGPKIFAIVPMSEASP